MADRYWVGGTGTWATTARWAASSGGAGGQSVPTANDDVYIDANSNTGTAAFTITVGANAVCRNISFNADGVCTFARGTTTLGINGSWFNSATNFTQSGTGAISFLNNAGLNGGTITTTSGTLWTATSVIFNNVNSTWTLASDWNLAVTCVVTHTAGAIDVAGYNWRVGSYISNSAVSARILYFRTGFVTLAIQTAAATMVNIVGTNWRCDCPRANSYNDIAAGVTGGFIRTFSQTATATIGGAPDGANEVYPYNAPNLSINGGVAAAIVTFSANCTVNNLNFTGSAGVPVSSATAITTGSRTGGFGVFIAGDCTFSSTATTYASLPLSFYRFVDQDTTTAQFNAQSKQLADGIAVILPQATDGTQTTMLITNPPGTATATNIVQLVKGRIQLSADWTVSMFRSSYTNVRGIDFDVYRILLNNAPATAKLNAPIIDNIDFTGSGGFGQSNNSAGTLTWGTTSGGSVTTAATYIATGTFSTGSLSLGGSHFKKIDFGSATTTFPTTSFFLYGDATLGTGTWSAVTITYYGSGGTDTLTTNSRVINTLTVNAPGSTLSLNGALTVGTTSSATGVILTYGTLQTNDNTLSMATFTVSQLFDYARTLALGTSQCPLTATTVGATIYNVPDAFNFTITGTGGFTRSTGAASSTISSTNVSNISSGFDGLPNFTFSGGSGAVNFSTASQIKTLSLNSGVTSSILGSSIQVYGNLLINSGFAGTLTGLDLILRAQGTQSVFGGGKTVGTLAVSSSSGGEITTFSDNIGCSTFTFTRGTIVIDTFIKITCTSFDSSGSLVRNILPASGASTGSGWTIPTNNATVIQLNRTNLTLNGFLYFNLSYTGSVGTRTISLTNFTAADTDLVPIATYFSGGFVDNTRNIYINPAATDTVAVQGTWKDMDLNISGSGAWAGTLSTGTGLTLFGNLALGNALNTTSTTSALTFAPTTAKNVTTSGRTINFPITFTTTSTTSLNFQDALTMSSLRALTITNGGILRLFSGVTSTVGSFVTTGTTMKYLQSSTSGSRATISAASGSFPVTYLSIKDSAATGGATWNATDPTNVDLGNNTGWIFVAGAGTSGNMFIIFN